MKKIYAPISSEQFDQLYRFGELYIPTFLVINSPVVSDELQVKLVQIFSAYLPFVYDENYLVIKCEANSNENLGFVHINIVDVEAIFPISIECANALELRKSNKIKFSTPILSSASYNEINDNFFISEAKKGIDCLTSLFKSDFENNFESPNDEIVNASLKARKNGKIDSLSPSSPLIDFVFLYVYQAYYPLTTLGYFYRTAEILTRKAVRERSLNFSSTILEKTEIYKLLEDFRSKEPNINLKNIVSTLEKESAATKFINNLSVQGQRFYIIIPMFLKLIDEFNEKGQQLESTSLRDLIKFYKPIYPSECQILIKWVGAYLGYGNCYDYYYAHSNLKFFKLDNSTDSNGKQSIEVASFTESLNEAKMLNEYSASHIEPVNDVETQREIPVEKESSENRILEKIRKGIKKDSNTEPPIVNDNNLFQAIESLFSENNKLKTKDILKMISEGRFDNLKNQKINISKLRAVLKEMKGFKKSGKGDEEYYEKTIN
jgi:hypothetical protein